MRFEKYVYNPHTLQFEKVKLTNKSVIFRILGFVSAVVISSIIIYNLTSEYFPSPREKALLKEINQLDYQLSSLKDKVKLTDKVVQNLQERDAKVHRVLLGMNPIDPAIWKSGIGGHDPNASNRLMTNGGVTLSETKNLVDQLERQVYFLTKSMDDVEKRAKENETMLASIPSIKPVRIDHLAKNVQQLSGWGIRLHPVHKINKMHTGIDFTAPPGTAIQATGDGRVEKVENKTSGYGRSVLINHGFGYKTLYAHMQTIKVRQGEKLKKGEVIGTIGNSGLSTGPHCHYEVWLNGRPINPIHHCLDGLSPKEYQELVEQASISNQSLD
ncbi:MAG: M23 family metallopeptidase [Saprospiraceae bacterium]|nr:M23 family metallopeptidase [Saprospiraceae bacterium]